MVCFVWARRESGRAGDRNNMGGKYQDSVWGSRDMCGLCEQVKDLSLPPVSYNSRSLIVLESDKIYCFFSKFYSNLY